MYICHVSFIFIWLTLKFSICKSFCNCREHHFRLLLGVFFALPNSPKYIVNLVWNFDQWCNTKQCISSDMFVLMVLFLELQNNYKHLVNSPWYIPGFQMLFPCRSQQGIIIVKFADFSWFRDIVTLFEIINDSRLKTELCITCFLFSLTSKFQMIILRLI